MDDDLPDTRLFVSGLPPNFTDDELGRHFAGRYQITDAQIIPGRRIGFVGFRNYTLARSAIAYFDKSYIRMSKIHVEFAKPLGQIHNVDDRRSKLAKTKSETYPRPSSPSPNLKNATSPTLAHKNTPEQLEGSKQFRSYTPMMKSSIPLKRKSSAGTTPDNKSGANSLLGQNGITKESQMKDAEQQRRKEKSERKHKTSEQGLEYNADDETFAVESGPPKKIKKKNKDRVAKDRKDSEEKSHESGGDFPGESNAQLHERVSDDNQLAKQPTDDDWLQSRTTGVLDLELEDRASTSRQPSRSKSVSPSTSLDQPRISRLISQDPSPKPSSIDASNHPKPNGRLFLRNLPFGSEEIEIKKMFSKFGEIEEVHIVRDSRSSVNKGFAYVQFTDSDSADKAMKTMDGKTFQGRLLHVIPATDKKSHFLDEFSISQLPLKRQKAIKKKAEANTSSVSWNSLYMNPDTVMATVAERLGVKKSDILNPTASDAAVKQAHAETHVIEETKSYFSEMGVNLNALRSKSRGGAALLVKNLAYGTTANEVKSLFEPYGQIAKLLFPPSGILAVVEYTNAADAHRAATKLAYRNYRGSVLFIQRAPEELFSHNNESRSIAAVVRKDDMNSIEGGQSSAVRQPNSTLFIRNLSFATTSARLTEYCRHMEGFLAAKVKTKPDAKNSSQTLSMGYGFAEFRAAQQAESALKALNGSHLDGHQLLVQFAQRSLDPADEQRVKTQAQGSQASKTKIIIKNLPFETTKKDVRALFRPYGQLRSVRVPKKFDRSTRGFAFADFVSGKEAANAINALENTHLLGRRLVLEFASEEAFDPEHEIQAIEKRVGKQTDAMNMKKIKGSGRQKFNLDGE